MAPVAHLRSGWRGAALAAMLALALRAGAAPEIVVTEIFVDASRDVDSLFLADGGRDLAAAGASALTGLLAQNAGWRVHPDFLSDPAREVGALALAGDRVYCRGVVSRADLRRNQYYGGLQLWTFSVGLRLEFFDIRTGQVWFGQGATVRVPVELVEEPDRATRQQQFHDAFDQALATAARLAGRNYRPGRLEAMATRVMADGLVAVDRGSRHGLGPGASGEVVQGERRWLLRLKDVASDYSLARVVAASGDGAPPTGVPVVFSGVNGLLAAEGPQLAVAGVAMPAPQSMDAWFDVDAATMGQWLHDAMVDTRAFSLLPPLLAGGGGSAALAAAFFRAQSVFAAVGDLRQDEIIGHRSLPQGLARVVVTHATLTRLARPGREDLVLRLGALLEIYDRRTHEVLLSHAVEGARAEKYNETYRKVDLTAAWRELARATLGDLARAAAGKWRPAGRDLAVGAGGTAGAAGGGVLEFRGEALPGERGQLLRPGEEVPGRDGQVLGRRLRQYGVAEVRAASPAPTAVMVLGDGSTTPASGDVLRLPARPVLPGAQVRRVTVAGKGLQADWRPDTLSTTLWAHQALAATGRYNMLAPLTLMSEIAAAEVAMAGGEFTAVDMDEILLSQYPQPQVLFDLRVGLARVDRNGNAYKLNLKFITGAELGVFDGEGRPLPVFQDAAGQPTHLVREQAELADEQALVNGVVVKGVTEAEFGDRLDASLRRCLEKLGAQLAKAAR